MLGETYGPDQTPADVLVMEGLAQEALGRADEAIESYRTALAKGNAPADAAERLAALGQPSVAAAPAVTPRSSSVR